MAKQQRDLIPVEDAVAEFQVARATLFRYITARKLKRFKRGMDRKTYVSRSEIKQLLAFREEKGS